ncbi:sodium/hydrogen exchanger [Aciduliprofundum boonei T469]|uniref:Sodium/hydrogen exchanger n=1 Tax=Aciduliprofundum boonei (strain DSM 19572 / T469) TaxID=439481 RepID=D3TD78_ACIB4|nr:sodium/hydrogen exchanger [Aciduliprofundum boonei T469]
MISLDFNISLVLHSEVDVVAYAVLIVLLFGIISLLISRRTKISYIPILILFGILIGPVLGMINRKLALSLFEYVRVFGLFMILFAEGYHLWRSLLVKNFTTIALLDTIGLLITALLAGFIFSLIFHVPFTVGFLFGAIVSATDPATLIPLFKQHKVDRNIETVIVTESIFNDPLGVVLTSLALAFVMPQAPSAQPVEKLAEYVTLYPAAILYFLYQVGMSIVIGAIVAWIGYEGIKKIKLRKSPYVEILAITLAFGGFVLGEVVGASGFLVATVIGILLGNYDDFFHDNSPEVQHAVRWHMHFNDVLAMLGTIFIFILLGASLNLSMLDPLMILYGSIIALFIVFVARPVAALVILPKWKFKKYLFISLEGPRGVVPSALASMPLMLGIAYNNTQMIHWGELILSTTIITVLLTVIIETLWVPYLKKKLLS